MKTIPLYAPVYCFDQPGGRTTCILINLQTRRVTHLVVKEASAPDVERLVPIEMVAKTSADYIRLRCSRDELKRMDPFVETVYWAETVPDYTNATGVGWMLPYVPLRRVWIETKSQQVPCGELALQQGARVDASDGPVGIVAGLKVEPSSKRVRQLIIEPSLPWDHRKIAVPVTQIGQAKENVVFLKLDKRSLDTLASRQTNQNLRRSTDVAIQ